MAYMGQAHQYLLPALNVLTYHDLFAWHEAKAGASYSAMYELAGSVEKVGVAPEPKRVGPASMNLEYG